VAQPVNLTFSTGSKTQHGGRWRYQFSVSWKVKSIIAEESKCHALLNRLKKC